MTSMVARVIRAARLLLGWVVPYNGVKLYWWIQEGQRRARRRQPAGRRSPGDRPAHYSYAEALRFLADAGLDIEVVRAMSMPEASLQYCCNHLRSDGGPLRGLHIGNFVGVSLAHFSANIKKLHEDSRIVSIDANLQQRGIGNPADIVVALLREFGLERDALMLIGYSLEGTGPDREARYDPARPLEAIATEKRLEGQLEALHLLGLRSLDFAVLDGSHDQAYVTRELVAVRGMLRANGLVFLDDASPMWPDLQRQFSDAAAVGFEVVGSDGRVGVMRKAAWADAS